MFARRCAAASATCSPPGRSACPRGRFAHVFEAAGDVGGRMRTCAATEIIGWGDHAPESA
ncbi:hypothetical protein JOD54_006417 [Actinokineospora baliensis]|uniref:hypothetical protein n=1 Tax=Actinokineospora baliensis TaxID=547056 RepID=UPI00195C6646|nr:hypothetical protein [Actinokineospora baliensis]MBM7776213.1 hypothetical protein [Actinokineospora baliensis]